MSRYPWRNTSEDIANQSNSQWETPAGAQAKADAAQAAAEKYGDEKLGAHIGTGGAAHALVTSNGAAGFMSAPDKKKLDGIEDGANKYVHPPTHPPSIIVQDANNRFVTDTQISSWNNKAPSDLATQSMKGLMSPEDKAKLDKSTNGMTPDTLILRDAGGRAKVAPPSASNDIARKQEVDDVQKNLDAHTANTEMHTTAAEHQKLAGIADGAEVNQNAFSKVNDIQASSKEDVLFIVGGIGITVSTDPVTKKVTVTATGQAAPGPHAGTHMEGGSDPIPNAVANGSNGLMSGADKAKLDGIETGANKYVHPATHPASMIVQDSTRRFITDDQAVAWDAKETPAGAQAKADAAQAAAEQHADTNLNTHIVDYSLHIPFGGLTTNSGNAYSISNPKIPDLIKGMAISLQINASSTAAATLNWDGKGAKTIKKANGGSVSNLKANGIYTFRYDGSAFILQGEGGAEGNVTADKVLSGTTYTDPATGDLKSGTMVNQGAVVLTPSTSNVAIPAGYHNGSGYVQAYVPGVKYATGQVTPPSNKVTITDRQGGSVSRFKLQVTGLTFKPNRIIMRKINGYTVERNTYVYYNGQAFTQYNNTVSEGYYDDSFQRNFSYFLNLDSNTDFFVNEGSFCLPVNFQETYEWEAFLV